MQIKPSTILKTSCSLTHLTHCKTAPYKELEQNKDPVYGTRDKKVQAFA
jgi:hypothetical protein